MKLGNKLRRRQRICYSVGERAVWTNFQVPKPPFRRRGKRQQSPAHVFFPGFFASKIFKAVPYYLIFFLCILKIVISIVRRA